MEQRLDRIQNILESLLEFLSRRKTEENTKFLPVKQASPINALEINPFAPAESSHQGLRDDIRLDVKIKQPRTLADTIGVARLIEERNQSQREPSQQFRSQSSLAIQKAPTNPTTGVLGPSPTQHMSKGSTPPPTTARRLTNQEARERREKGLCYYCDEKFILGHRCERPQLFLIEDAPWENEWRFAKSDFILADKDSEGGRNDTYNLVAAPD